MARLPLAWAGVSREPALGERPVVAYLFLLPAFLLYAALVLLPALATIWISFYEWEGIGPLRHWVGLANYLNGTGSYDGLRHDERFRHVFAHSLTLIVFYSILPVAIALLIVAVMSRAPVRGLAAYRAVLFLPQVLPLVAVGIIWRWLYQPDYEQGPINRLLAAVGLGGLRRAWLGDFAVALPAIGVIGTWVLFGLCMVLFIAGVQKIPPSLYDTTRVDGAGPLREFLAVTLPGLRNEIVVAVTLTMILALRAFDVIAVTTRGGPGDATNVPAYEIYNRAFSYGFVGSAAAAATALGVVILVLSTLVRLAGERRAPGGGQ